MKNKTPEEILEMLDCIYHDNSGNKVVYCESVLLAMKEYAQSCCEDLRKRIAENVKLGITINDIDTSGLAKENINKLITTQFNIDPSKIKLKVDKGSILNTEIILL